MAGDYNGKIKVWSDTSGNEELDSGEAYTEADVKITVEAVSRLSIREDGAVPTDITTLVMPVISNNQTVSKTIRLYNTGNVNITNSIYAIKNELRNLSATIGTDRINMQIDNGLPITPGNYVIATISVSLDSTILNSGHYLGIQEFWSGSVCSDSINLDVEYAKKELILNPNPLVFGYPDGLMTGEYLGTVTATSNTRASLNNIWVKEKSSCDCGKINCGNTTINMLSEQNQSIITSLDYTFQLNVDTSTAAGLHIATWTFFDDSDGDGLYDEGEYFVDLSIRYFVAEVFNVSIEPQGDYNTIVLAPGESIDLTYHVRNNSNTAMTLNTDENWHCPYGTVKNENGDEFDLNSNFYIVEQPESNYKLNIGDIATLTVSLEPYFIPGLKFTPTKLYPSYFSVR